MTQPAPHWRDEMPQDYATVQALVTLVGPRDLREAINRGKLEIALQPMVELRSGRPTRIEALCRWNHASGKVTPAQFIPMAEANDRACIALAHDLALEAVAEGVEDRETWTLLRALGCDTAQGHYSGSPMP